MYEALARFGCGLAGILYEEPTLGPVDRNG